MEADWPAPHLARQKKRTSKDAFLTSFITEKLFRQFKSALSLLGLDLLG